MLKVLHSVYYYYYYYYYYVQRMTEDNLSKEMLDWISEEEEEKEDR